MGEQSYVKSLYRKGLRRYPCGATIFRIKVDEV